MIRDLSITNLGVIGSTTLEFSPGLTVLTGETGAGKTLITTALSLLLGAKADSALVRHGAQEAAVDCRIVVGDDALLLSQLDEVGAVFEDGEVIVTRTVGSRSRAFLGSRPVAATVLAGVLGDRLTVHGQHGQVRLTRSADQRMLLDAVDPAIVDPLAIVRTAWQNHRDAVAALAAAEAHTAQDAQQIAAHQALVDDVSDVAPVQGEDATLDARIELLASREAVERAMRTAYATLIDGDALDITDATSLLGQVRRLLEPHSALPEIATWLARLDETFENLRELGHDIGVFVDTMDADDRSLDDTLARRARIGALLRRWNTDLDTLLERSDAAAKALALAADPGEQLAHLRHMVEHCEQELEAACAALHGMRVRVAQEVSERVTAELRELGLPHAEFHIAVERAGNPASHGDDLVEFRFTANPGQPAQALATVGSGGELSRVMLALETVAADAGAHRTFVFDEVDAGIGGRAALEVGRRLSRLAETAQVVVVTHLAQVAAFADAHIVVEKVVADGETLTHARTLTQPERPRELTRLLSGVEESASAVAHAGELLELAAADRRRRG